MPFKDPEKAKQYNTEYARKWRAEHPERVKERLRKWAKNNPDKIKVYKEVYYKANREKEIKRIMNGNKKRYTRMRHDAIIHYGGNPPKCSCCGETQFLFLTIHHMNNDGAKHRKEMKGKYHWGIYEYLYKEKYPPGFGVLCYNCNAAIGHYGACPHEQATVKEARHTGGLAPILPSGEK